MDAETARIVTNLTLVKAYLTMMQLPNMKAAVQEAIDKLTDI